MAQQNREGGNFAAREQWTILLLHPSTLSRNNPVKEKANEGELPTGRLDCLAAVPRWAPFLF
jgi:hypothetical protein